MKILILGSKEYPLGTNTEDVFPSGGIEVYVTSLISHFLKVPKTEEVIITRKFATISEHEKMGNVEILRVPWLKGFFLRNISFNFMAFMKALRFDYEIIHSHGPIATFFGIVLSKIKKVPIVATPHGLALEQPQYNAFIRWFFSILERFAYSKPDAIVFLSEQEKTGFRKKLRFLPNRYRIIPPGVDIPKFDSGNKHKIQEEFLTGERTVITFIGRLIGVKGLRYLIEAVSNMQEDFLLLIVGDGPQKGELKKMVSRSKLENVVFTGFRNDIADILAATDIFVLPSLSEGLPTSLLEAMAAAKACIVTDIGLPIEHEIEGLVVKAGDENSLRNALQVLIENNKLRKKLGENAKRKAEKEFSWKNAVKVHLEMYNEFLS
jgi:glycosyltransferase involved in cell wall biosynthesis